MCKQNATADRLFVIKSGIVDIETTFDNRIDNKFIIEKLCRGAVVNHNAFLLYDEADTDFRCATTVVTFEITKQKID